MNSTYKASYEGRISVFYDGADEKVLLQTRGNAFVRGFTTNPSLLSKTGKKDYPSACKELLKLTQGKPISFEVIADDPENMKRQALEIRSWGRNVFIKVPITNSRGESCLPLVHTLAKMGAQLNVTALFTPEQVQATCEALKGGADSIVSIFAGRIADTGRDPEPVMKKSVEIRNRFGTPKQMQILWASCRELYNIIQAEACGCDIITVPESVLSKWKFLNIPLTEMSLDTVRQFKKDADSAGFQF